MRSGNEKARGNILAQHTCNHFVDRLEVVGAGKKRLRVPIDEVVQRHEYVVEVIGSPFNDALLMKAIIQD
eukprot:scaffold404857_cov51-Prasinocladus_malaysianus.AAC.2